MLVTRNASIHNVMCSLAVVLALLFTSSVVPQAFADYAAPRESSRLNALVIAMLGRDGLPPNAPGKAAIAEAPGIPVKLVFVRQPSNALAQAMISPGVQVVVEDSNGIPVPTTTRVTLVLTNVFGLRGTRTVTPQNGIATFSDLSVKTDGTYTLSATSPGLTSATSTSFTITGASGSTGPLPFKVAFLVQPSDALTQATIYPAVQVVVQDANGIPVATSTRVTLVLTGVFGLAGIRTVTPQNGIANFANLSVGTPGRYTLSATSPGLSSATSVGFTVTLPGITIQLPSSSTKVGNTLNGSITLAQSAGPQGANVTLASVSPNYVVVSPGPVAIAAGQTTGTFTYTGVGVGNSTINATATGYNPASVPVDSIANNSGSVSTVESLGAIPATQAFNGLGFNLTTSNDWEFRMAAAAGATHARYQCSWVTTENQTVPPNNTDDAPQFTLQPDCQAALVSAANVGTHSTIVAAYGAPYHQILTVTLPAGASAGATVLNVEFASGVGGDTLSSMAPFYDTIIGSSNNEITKKHSYAGGLITGITLTDATHATLTLASALASSLPANATAKYIIHEYLYPPPASSSPTDPSVVAYAKYAAFLADRISESGVSGEVELWNEPPWSSDPWDNRGDYYDVWPGSPTPGPQASGYPNAGFVAALQAMTTPAETTYNWGGTEKSGANSVFFVMPSNTSVAFNQPNTAVVTESFHPYGNNPEDELWSGPCLAATINPYPATPKASSPCNLGDPNSNIVVAVQKSLVQRSRNPSWGIAHNITETGIGTATVDQAQQARFIMRQFLGYQAAGVSPVQFYRLYDVSSGGFGFVDPTTHDPLPSYTAIAGLMSDLKPISNAAVGSGSLPAIISYSGTYPLETVSIIGTRSGDTVNSIIFSLWQRSNTTTGKWAQLDSPPAASVTVQIPPGLYVVSIVNLDTRESIPYTTSGQQINLDVSDDPLEVLLMPSS